MASKSNRRSKTNRDALLHQNKLASPGKLAVSVVHEINNALSGRLNLTMLIGRIVDEESIHLKEGEQFRQYLNLMEGEIRRIGRIASNLPAFSREKEVEPKPLKLNHLSEKTRLLNTNLFKINSIKVAKKLSSRLPGMMGSEDHLQQVLMNIFLNAIEAMVATAGGVLSIKTRYSMKEKKIYASIGDSGDGTSPENLPRLFDPFFTTKDKGRGVGLGLSVAYDVIKEHPGAIEAESQIGKGTPIFIEFPLQPQAVGIERSGV